MDLDLTDDQEALVSAVRRIVQDHNEIPASDRRGAYFYSAAFDRDLTENGFFEACRQPELGAVGAVLVTEEASRSPAVVEVGASSLVAPHIFESEIPRPIVLAHGDLRKPQRFLPMARSLLIEDRDSLLMVAVDPARVETVHTLYGYPYGRFLEVPDLRGAQRIGGASAVAAFHQWWRVANAAEAAGLMRSAVDFTVDYVKQRRLFNTTVASFQSVQHRLAHAHRIAEAIHWLTLKAAWSGDPFDAVQASSFALQHITKVVFDLHQFNGAMGITLEHLLHYWTYRLRALQSELGGTDGALLETADLLWGAAD